MSFHPFQKRTVQFEYSSVCLVARKNDKSTEQKKKRNRTKPEFEHFPSRSPYAFVFGMIEIAADEYTCSFIITSTRISFHVFIRPFLACVSIDRSQHSNSHTAHRNQMEEYSPKSDHAKCTYRECSTLVNGRRVYFSFSFFFLFRLSLQIE